MRMCSCRGTAGFAHVSCLAEQAKILVAEVDRAARRRERVADEHRLRNPGCQNHEVRPFPGGIGESFPLHWIYDKTRKAKLTRYAAGQQSQGAKKSSIARL